MSSSPSKRSAYSKTWRPRHWPSGVAMSGPAASGRVGRPGGREIVPTQRSSVRRSPSVRRLVLGQALREQDERPERDGAEHVRRRHRRLDPVRARRRRRERTADDRELALGPHLVGAAVGADEDAEPVVLRLVLDDARQLDTVEALRRADRRLDPDPRQLVLEHERVAARRRQCRPARAERGLAAGAKRVQVADVRLVLEESRLGDRVEVERALRERRAAPAVGRRSRRARTNCPSTTRRRRNGSVFTSAPPTPSASRST